MKEGKARLSARRSTAFSARRCFSRILFRSFRRAIFAHRLDFERRSQHGEFSQLRTPLEQPIERGNLDIANPPAFDAHHMMMRRDIAVVPRVIMQHGDLARLTNLAERLQRAMHRGERDGRMLAANRGEDRVGPRMLPRSEQRLDNRKPLRRHREPTLAASRSKLRKPLNRVRSALPLIYKLQFHNLGDNYYHLIITAVKLDPPRD